MRLERSLSVRVRAIGTSFYGSDFHREQMLTAAVYPGGGRSDGTGGPHDDGTGDGHPGSSRFTLTTAPIRSGANLLRCLLSGNVIDKHLLVDLKKRGLNLEALLRCLDKHCHQTGQKRKSTLSPEAIRRIVASISSG